jgi:hypothetical protein
VSEGGEYKSKYEQRGANRSENELKRVGLGVICVDLRENELKWAKKSEIERRVSEM